MDRKYLGIELGTCNIKIIDIAIKKESIVFSNPLMIKTPRFFMQNGQLANKEELKELLKNELSQRKHKKQKLLVVLNDQMAITRDREMPPVDHKEMDRMIKLDACEYLPGDIQDYTIRHRILLEAEKSPKKTNFVLVTLARTDLLNELCQLFKELSLNPTIMDIAINSMMKYMSCVYQKKKGDKIFIPKEETGPAILLDMGAGAVKMIILHNDKPVFQQTMAHSAQRIDVMIANSLGIERAQAEEYKIKYGLSYLEGIMEDASFDPQDEMGISVSRVIADQVNLLLNEVYKNMQTFMQKNDFIPIHEIWLTGGMATMKGLDDYMKRAFSIPCFVVQCGKEMGLDLNQIPYFTNLAGAAMRGE